MQLLYVTYFLIIYTNFIKFLEALEAINFFLSKIHIQVISILGNIF